jgi:hypothetical protein
LILARVHAVGQGVQRLRRSAQRGDGFFAYLRKYGIVYITDGMPKLCFDPLNGLIKPLAHGGSGRRGIRAHVKYLFPKSARCGAARQLLRAILYNEWHNPVSGLQGSKDAFYAAGNTSSRRLVQHLKAQGLAIFSSPDFARVLIAI